MDELQAGRGRRRLRSDDAVHSASTVVTSRPSVVSAAEAAATLEFLDELGEFLELEQQPQPPPLPAAAAALEPIPFETSGYGSSQSSPLSGCELTEQQQLDADAGDDGEDYDSAAAVVKPARKKKKSSTQRQKEELTYLRTKVGQLERELNDMKTVFLGSSLTQEGHEDTGNTSSFAMHSSSSTMWELMAQRQLREKNRAEMENAQLKETMEAQIKLAKGLERMLRKRQVWDEMQESVPFDIVVEQESEIYAFMCKSIEARIPLADAIFDDPKLFGQGCVQKSEANTVHSDSEGLHVEFVEARTIPFDFRATARMTWKHMGTKNPKLKTVAVNTLLLEQTEDSLTTKHLLTTVTAGQKRTTTTRSQHRRIQCEDHVLMVWHSIMENKGEPQSGKAGIHITLQGCSKIAKAETKDGAVAATIFSFVHMTPKIANSSVASSDLFCGASSSGLKTSGGNMQLLPQSKSEEAAGGIFTEVMITSFQQSVHVVQQAIENNLMDEFLEQQRSTQCEIVSL